MGNIIWLIIFEIVAISFWIIGYSCTKNKSNFPNTSMGYKTPRSVLNRNTWDYSNEFAGKLCNIIGTVLFVVNAVAVLVLEITWPMIFINIFAYVILFITVQGALDKRFTETGKIKKGI